MASIALETSKIGLASTLVNSAADEDRSRLPRSGRYVRREPLNAGAHAQSAEAIDLARKKRMIRRARAMWHGTGRAGSGSLSSDSGVLSDTPYSFRTRFENEKGTNPEELIAAAHAGCFTMALAFGLQAAGFTPTELSTEAAVTLDQDGQAFRISRSALTLRAKVRNLDDAAFARIAGEAEKNCPVSKVLNAAITLDAKLTP